MALSSASIQAAVIIKADNADDLSLTTSWVGGAVPGVSDIATWNSAMSGVNAVLLGGNASWQGISILNPAGAVTLGAGDTLTLGRSGIDMSAATQDLTIHSGLTLMSGTNQMWNVTSGRTLTLSTGTFTRGAGATLNVQGAGTVSAGTMINDASGLLGPWASFGTGAATAYAAISGGSITAYTGGTAAATAADVTSTSGTLNYDVAAVGAFGAGASFQTLRYSGAAGVINGAFTANGLMNVGGGLLTLDGGVTIGSSNEFVIHSANGDLLLSSAIGNNGANPSSLTKMGAGILTLSGANTFTGGTYINQGTIEASHVGGLGGASNAVYLAEGATLHLKVAGAATYTFGNLSGGGTIHALLGTGSSTLVLANSNLDGFTGVLNIGNGTGGGKLSLSATTGATSAAAIHVNPNATLYVLGGITVNAPLTLYGGNTGESLGQLRIDQSSVYAGPITIAGDVDAADFTVGGGNASTLSGVISESGGARLLSKGGTGNITFTAANTYTGGTRVGSGTLTLGNGGSTGSLSVSGGVTISSGATLAINRSNSVVQGTDFSAAPITGAGSLSKLGTGALTLNAANTYSGATTVSDGVLRLAHGNAVQNSTLTINAANGISFAAGISSFVAGGLAGNSSGTLVLADEAASAVALSFGGNHADTTFSGTISGSGSLVKNGNGVASFNTTSVNTYAGGTTINSGTVRFGVATSYTASGITSGSLGIGPVTFGGGTTLATLGISNRHLFAPQINILGDMTIGQTSGGTGGVDIGGTIDLNGGTRTLTVVNGASTVVGGNQKLSFRNDFGQTVVQNGTIRLVGDSSFASGTEAFIYVNTGGMSFTNNAGLTVGPRAHLYFRNSNLMGTGSTAATLTIEAGGVVDLSDLAASSRSQEIYSLSGAGILTNSNTGSGTATLTVSGAASTIFSGTLQNGNAGNGGTGKVALTKSGTGMLTLSGTNTASGVTTVSAGTLKYGQVSALYNGDTSKWTAGNLRVAAGGTLAFNVGGTGEFSTSDVTTLLTNLANSSNATTNGMAAGSVLGFDTTNASGGKFMITNVITNTGGTAGGARGLTKQGAGTLVLTNANTYSGATTVSGGVLQVGSAGTGSTGSGAVIVQNGGTLLGSGVVKGSSFTAQSGSTIQAGDGTGLSDYGTLTFTPVSGSGSFDFLAGSSIILGINPFGTGDLLSFDGLGAGTLNFNGNLQITASGFTPTSAQTFDLIDWSGLTGSPTFADRFSGSSYSGYLLGNGDDNLGFDLPDISASGFVWDISDFIIHGTISTVVMVPEPSRALMATLGVGICLLRRRRLLRSRSIQR